MNADENGRTLPDKGRRIHESPVVVAIVLVLFLYLAFALTYPRQLLGLPTLSQSQQSSKINASLCASLTSLNLTRPEIESLIEYSRRVTEHVNLMAESLNRTAKEREVLLNILTTMMDDRKAGPLGTVKVSPTNPAVIPDAFLNPRLSKLLEEVAVGREVLAVMTNKFAMDKLDIWVSHVKKVGIPNYLVIALDDETATYCVQNNVRVYKRDPDEAFDKVAKSDYTGTVSGLKFWVLREFLQLGYGVILSDVDVIHLQNPFNHLYRDSDVESMTDGYDNGTAYGRIEEFEDPDMGWSALAHTTRLWVFNSGYFYLRPTKPSIELLDRVWSRMEKDLGQWDQDLFNEELFFPSHPGYVGLHASKRCMDIYQFMSSKVLFKIVRKDPALRKLLPVVVHVNYHPDKFERMHAAIDFYVNGNETALDPFPDGTV